MMPLLDRLATSKAGGRDESPQRSPQEKQAALQKAVRVELAGGFSAEEVAHWAEGAMAKAVREGVELAGRVDVDLSDNDSKGAA